MDHLVVLGLTTFGVLAQEIFSMVKINGVFTKLFSSRSVVNKKLCIHFCLKRDLN